MKSPCATANTLQVSLSPRCPCLSPHSNSIAALKTMAMANASSILERSLNCFQLPPSPPPTNSCIESPWSLQNLPPPRASPSLAERLWLMRLTSLSSLKLSRLHHHRQVKYESRS